MVAACLLAAACTSTIEPLETGARTEPTRPLPGVGLHEPPSGPAVPVDWEAARVHFQRERWYAVQWFFAVHRFAHVQALRMAAAVERAKASATKIPVGQTTGGSGRCGGSLPPCSVMQCESGGDIHAQNPSSSASGKWQVIDSTWGNFMGYPTAASAPEWVQDEFARQLYAGGAGRGHWAC